MTKLVVPPTTKALAFGDDDNRATNNYMSTCVRKYVETKSILPREQRHFHKIMYLIDSKSKHIGNRPSTIEKKARASSGHFLPITLFFLTSGLIHDITNSGKRALPSQMWHNHLWPSNNEPALPTYKAHTLPVRSSSILLFFSLLLFVFHHIFISTEKQWSKSAEEKEKPI